MEEEMTIEQHFDALEGILQKLEDRDISLEDSFVAYQQGMAHLAACHGMLDEVEKKVKLLQGEGKFEDFEEE